MAALGILPDASLHARPSAQSIALTHRSSARENVFEHMLLGQVGAEFLARGLEYDELHSSVDRNGYDVLLQAASIPRHIQLKVMIAGGARADVTVNTRLAELPSGCVIWLTYEPIDRRFSEIRWFGGKPGEPLPQTGDKVARHSRANSEGVKKERPDHRVIPARRFERLDDIEHLADRLFGMHPPDPLALLRSRVRPGVSNEHPWIGAVSAGNFSAIPNDISWERGGREVASLLNGYHLLELISDESPADYLARQQHIWNETGRLDTDAIALWTTLFLEGRADHFGQSDFATSYRRQDTLVRQLRNQLVQLENADA